jgi:cyclic pyranopterin phosphate synthase
MDHVLPSAQVIDRIAGVFPIEQVEPSAEGETAERWRYLDGGGEIGVISSVTQAFCRDCNRARLSTEGKLYLCLFATQGHDLRHLLREANASDEQIAGAVAEIWSARRDRYSELRGAGVGSDTGQRKVEMHYIGG